LNSWANFLTTYLSAIFQFSDCLRRRPICCPSQVDEDQWAGSAYCKMSNPITKGSRLKNNAVGSGAMPTSISNVFCRVNRRRPCRICGKPDWWVFVRDGERVSICMRVSDGAHKINRHGGAIFIHDDWREEKGIDISAVADIPQSPIAPIEIRDFVYGRLIEISPAMLYPAVLIAGENGLLARGLSECHFGNYCGLPASSGERDRLARLLLQEMNDLFPDTGSLRGVPGFWKDGQGTHLWKPKDYLLLLRGHSTARAD
jgi:hypothetical protein